MCRSDVVLSNESEHSNAEPIQENVVAVGENDRDDDAVLRRIIDFFLQMEYDVFLDIVSHFFWQLMTRRTYPM